METNEVNTLTPPQDIINLSTINEFVHIESVLKIGLVIFLIVYTIMSIVVIKQINLMSSTINNNSNKYLYVIAYFHLFIVVFCLVFVLFGL